MYLFSRKLWRGLFLFHQIPLFRTLIWMIFNSHNTFLIHFAELVWSFSSLLHSVLMFLPIRALPLIVTHTVTIVRSQFISKIKTNEITIEEKFFLQTYSHRCTFLFSHAYRTAHLIVQSSWENCFSDILSQRCFFDANAKPKIFLSVVHNSASRYQIRNEHIFSSLLAKVESTVLSYFSFQGK